MRRALVGAAVTLAVSAGCAPALRRPRPVGALGTPAAAAGRTAPELVAEGRASYARRPDAAQVQRAEALFLAAAEADPHDIQGLFGAIEAKIWRIDHEAGVDRAALAATAVDAGQLCLQRAAESAWCHYGLALGLGMQAREHRATAVEGLKRMVEHLRRAAAADAAIDEAGPERVLALVLTRAPAWPLGPGDPESAVEAARRSVQRAPAHPPNLLALAEALLGREGNDGADEARALAERALALARERTDDPDAPEWARDAQELVARARKAIGGTA